jgi:hypothetical protein
MSLKRPIISFFLLICFSNCIKSQNKLVLNNNAYLVISNSSFLVVDNSNSDAITTIGSGGNIITESEFNRLKWNIGNSTGSYTVPFTSSSNNKIPLVTTITGAGTGTGSIVFSTYNGGSWDNDSYKPSDVLNMQAVSGATNNSAYVLDRFWIIDAQNYTTKPSSTILFNYQDAEWSAGGNSIVESDLFVQRYNSSTNTWGDWFGTFGSTNTGSNKVSSGNINPNDFYRSWTLVDQQSPLPIELLFFNVTCDTDNKRNFNWATASESNNDFFTIEASKDAITWDEITKIDGAGNSSIALNYHHKFDIENTYEYFRLKQTDFNGTYKYSSIEHNRCAETNQDPSFLVFPNPGKGNLNLVLSSFDNEPVQISITNALGQKIINETITNPKENSFMSLYIKSTGLYYLTVSNSSFSKTKKIIIE